MRKKIYIVQWRKTTSPQANFILEYKQSLGTKMHFEISQYHRQYKSSSTGAD